MVSSLSFSFTQPAGGRVAPTRALATALLLLLLSPGWTRPGRADEFPETPAITPDVVGTIDGRQVHGHISERRGTFDGRVRITGTGIDRYKLHTARPELFASSLAEERKRSEGKPLSIDQDSFHASKGADRQTSHVTLCDPYLAAETAKNPYACRAGAKPADCYDVSVIQMVRVAGTEPSLETSEIWSTPVTITVRDPKTPRANVTAIEFRGPPVRSPIRRSLRKSGDIFLEPVVSGDGRLLILNSGDTLLYSVIPPGREPCDARNWTRLAHLSELHRDAGARQYGIARYPIRDSENRPIKPGKPIRGAYPWIDRAGKNLLFAQVGGTGMFYFDAGGQIGSRFEVLNPPRKRRLEVGGPTRFGVSLLGLWSQGKIVVLDNRVNNNDFHLGLKGYRPRVQLYRDQPNGVVLEQATVSKLSSPENQWHYNGAFLPRSPRDVAWWVAANNDMTDELVFDDLLDLGSLIYSPMNASVDNKRRAWRDGFDTKRHQGYVKRPRIQNAAASELRWRLPRFGSLFNGRVEPIAAGGVSGKGLWLDGDRTRLTYSIPEQFSAGAMADATWTTTLWLDSRRLSSRNRLLTFPDRSWVDIAGGRLVLGNDAGSETHIDLGLSNQFRARRWSHVAFVSRPTGIDVYLDGFKWWSGTGAFLRARPGTLTIGRTAEGALPGFDGWIDEFRVTSGAHGPEAMCNFAHGTLRGLDATTDPSGFAVAGAYPQDSHDEISARLGARSRPTWERYRCERERSETHTCLDSIHRPGGGDPACVRAALQFPEGPLFHDLPRPDSRPNSFCRSCHAGALRAPGLRIGGPLRAGPDGTTLAQDARRQTLQTPRRIHGVVPEGLLGSNPTIEAPADGILLDPWLIPGAAQSLDHD